MPSAAGWPAESPPAGSTTREHRPPGQRALDEGLLRPGAGDAVTITWVLWAGLHGALAAKVAMPNLPGPVLDEVVDAVLGVFLRGVLAD